MNVQLIYQDETSNKFWNIVVEGNKYTFTYGRIGSEGSTKDKEFADEATALKAAQKMVSAKMKKGYKLAIMDLKDVVRDNYTFAGKIIKSFGSKLEPETAVKVSSGYDDEVRINEKLDKLAKQPNIAEMDTLVIGEWNEAAEGEGCDDVLEKIVELKDSFSGLKHLFVGDMNYEECEMSWIIQANYKYIYEHFPNLETLGIRGGESLVLDKINLPKLKNLVIETGGLDTRVVKQIIDSELKGLEHLEIWLGTGNYGGNVKIEDLKPILNGNYPNLKYLGLKNYDFEGEVAKALQGASILNSLEILDLSMGILKDDGAEALYNNDALLKLKHINCRHHFISDEWVKKLETKFAEQKINLADQEDSEDGDYFFVEIGE